LPISIDDIERESFFSALAPDLVISGAVQRSLPLSSTPVWSPGGYARLPEVILPDRVAPMARAVTALVERGVHPIFAYVYDAFWEPALSVRSFANAVLGSCDLVRDGWAWFIPPGPEHAGWLAHRDWRVREHELITVWVALTDANEDNSCIYLVPLDRDPAYAAGTLDDDSVPRTAAVCLPAKAATALAWSQHVLHWGGPSTERARGARISFSYSFAKAGTPERTPIDLSNFSFKDRLDTIAQMIVAYRHQVTMPPELDQWAEMLVHLRRVGERLGERGERGERDNQKGR
jgi:hypothetical protein